MARERRLVLAAAAAVAVVAAAGACKRDRESPAPPPRIQAQLPPPLAGNSFYRVDAGPRTRCTAGASCEARIVLSALGAYHVNQKYPFKFVSDPVPGVAVDGTGAFALDDARTGTLTLRFRAERGGPARFTGTFKLSVCTDEQCEIEEPRIEFELPVG